MSIQFLQMLINLPWNPAMFAILLFVVFCIYLRKMPCPHKDQATNIYHSYIHDSQLQKYLECVAAGEGAIQAWFIPARGHSCQRNY